MAIDKFQGKTRWLSNYGKSPVEFDGIKFQTAEAAYQAFKTKDYEEKVKIADAKTPAEAKRLGNLLTLDESWNNIRVSMMEIVLRKKFPSDKEEENFHLTTQLVLTGGEELIEGNDWNDKFWGVCDGEGENNLGKILMKIRNERSKYF